MPLGRPRPRKVAHPEEGLRGLSATVLEAALRNCGYEDVVVDAALFVDETDGMFRYHVGTGSTEEDMVLAVALVSLHEGELVAVLLNKAVFEGMDLGD